MGRKTYNQEFKDEAVALARTEGVGAGKAAAQLGVSVYTIRAWMKGQGHISKRKKGSSSARQLLASNSAKNDKEYEKEM